MTCNELIACLKEYYTAEELVDILKLTAEEIVDEFNPRIEEEFEQLCERVSEDQISLD